MQQPPVVKAGDSPTATGVDRLRWYRDAAYVARGWRWTLFVLGLLLCSVGTVGCEVLAFQAREAANAQATLAGRSVTIESGSRFPVFWFGLALIGLSELTAINLAIRETHLEEAERRK